MLSIVIPALNEENYLPKLVESIKGQNFQDYEIIVADANSNDKTVEIAEKEKCRVIFSNGRLPAREKNKGADFAQRDIILFVDADVILPSDFFKNALREFKEKNLGVASFYLKSKNKMHNFLYGFFYNFPAKITEKILPQAMNAIMVKKNLHQKIGGFDEKIKLGEELYYIRRARRFGKFGILKSAKILASSRRFEQDGWFKTWLKYFLCQLHMIFLGPVKSDIFKYRFNHYSQKTKNELK